MTIVATAPVPAATRLDTATTEVLPAAGEPCPAWCTRHIDDDDDQVVMHMSEPVFVEASAERTTNQVHVELYRLEERPGSPGVSAAVYIDGGSQTSMTPGQALQLAQVLVELAGRALGVDAQDGHFPPGTAAKIYRLGRDAGLRASREDAYWRGYDAGMKAMAGCAFDEYGDIVSIDGAKPA